MSDLRPAARLYIAAIVALALAAGVVTLLRGATLDARAALTAALAAATALAFRFPLAFDRNTRYHLDTAAIFAGVLILDPGPAILAVAVGTFAVNVFSLNDRDVGGFVQAAFNAAQTALQAAGGALVLIAAGWDPAAPAYDDPPLLLALLAAGAVMYLVNTLAIATIVAIQTGARPLAVWLSSSVAMDRVEWLAHLAQLGLGLLAGIVAAAHPWALTLLLLPALTVHNGLRGHVRVRRSAEQRLAVAQRIAHLGSWEWDLTVDRHTWSDETFRILGHEPDESGSAGRLLAAVHPDDRDTVQAALTELATGTNRSLEHRIRLPDGGIRVTHLIGEVERDRAGRPERVLGTLHDITDRKRLEDALTHRAYHDPLTGLPNRALFEERLVQALSRAHRQQRGLAVLFLDLDGFKAVNDEFGHDAGDELLLAVAGRLRGCVRAEDTVARRGGDEFTVLLEDLDELREAEQIAARLIAVISAPFPHGTAEVTVGVSVGIAHLWSAGPTPVDPQALLTSADRALYAAKSGGRGRYVVAVADGAAIDTGDPVWSAAD